MTIINKTDSAPVANKFNNYLNISIEVSPGKWVRMPLNCAIPTDDKNLSADQKKLRDMMMDQLDKTDDEEKLTLNWNIKGILYRRKEASDVDTSNWSNGFS